MEDELTKLRELAVKAKGDWDTHCMEFRDKVTPDLVIDLIDDCQFHHSLINVLARVLTEFFEMSNATSVSHDFMDELPFNGIESKKN